MREQAPDEAIVGVRFEPHGPVHYFDGAGTALSVGDTVSVETDCGARQGRVAIAPGQVLHSDLRGPLDRVLGKVDEDPI
jgi:cell fate regulator YaaT (PSP1 superfamily)